MPTSPRLDFNAIDPNAFKAVLALEKFVHGGTLGEPLLALVKSRSSQINHCAWCLDMHMDEARRAGLDQRKLDVLAAWREAGDMFTAQEQAALALTEQVTLISVNGVTDEVWAQVREQFDEQQSVTLIMAIAAINVWNRMNVAVRTPLPDKPGGW